MDNIESVNILLTKYLNREISSAELDELLVRLNELDDECKQGIPALKQLWEDTKSGQVPSGGQHVNWEKMYAAVTAEPTHPVTIIRIYRKYRSGINAAAILIIIVSFFALYYNQPAKAPVKKQIVTRRLPANQNKNILPGKSNAVLTLANGSQIVLDKSANGLIGTDGGMNIYRMSDGSLAYKNVSGPSLAYNLISVPRAAQSQLMLSDGSRVWLNAASSLRFPASFPSDERVVELTGEAYFEIAKNAASPFRVIVHHQDQENKMTEIKVLGTHFNVMAYPEESVIRTTLLEGSVQLVNGSQQAVLKPGKQALVYDNTEQINTKTVDTDMAVAWKNGYFHFDKADASYILRQIGRWYNLNIVYEGKAPDLIFSGKIERNLPLSSILRLLEQGNIRFKVVDNTMIVSQ